MYDRLPDGESPTDRAFIVDNGDGTAVRYEFIPSRGEYLPSGSASGPPATWRYSVDLDVAGWDPEVDPMPTLPFTIAPDVEFVTNALRPGYSDPHLKILRRWVSAGEGEMVTEVGVLLADSVPGGVITAEIDSASGTAKAWFVVTYDDEHRYGKTADVDSGAKVVAEREGGVWDYELKTLDRHISINTSDGAWTVGIDILSAASPGVEVWIYNVGIFTIFVGAWIAASGEALRLFVSPTGVLAHVLTAATID